MKTYSLYTWPKGQPWKKNKVMESSDEEKVLQSKRNWIRQNQWEAEIVTTNNTKG